ncbi:P-loop NTPase fold protein [Streptomyces sp. NPDC056056]|uniref:KAP family P-loop NTPase fold protein n=1 Tax=Streptomyces sp. NPDC056056 TaxID=3345698 RepID=UPI0035DA9E5E
MADVSGGRLQSDDLVQDREIEDGRGDRLAHSHIAGQLQHLVRTVPTPTNIAVWGPWGSGKSGIANLLRGELSKDRGVRFVRFDAFKYAENPLRRNFIIAVASALGIEDQRYHADLYSGQVTARIEFSGGALLKLLWTYARMFGLIAGVSVLVVALLAWAKTGPFQQTFIDMATDVLKAGLAPAALLTSLTVLVSRTLTREHKTDAADSDEQFEKLFSSLVAQSKVKRLVVFVDELDRCAPSDVVATLDALRTFLGVERCVFIVAADQQVLEEALTRALQQATPADAVNPYYSSGSGYLDKVFPYQISLPPLLVGRVTSFAAGLVRGRGGVWAKVDVDLIVSILIPSHVRSPRRVKALLNAFVLTYRLAEQRSSDGLLETDPSLRAAEIARLVCLRVEFPLFARDLLLDHRLCDHVVRFADAPDAELSGFVSPEVREAAKAYAIAQAPVDVHLSTADGHERESAAVHKSHGRQLLAYLSKTRTVPGPGQDLIFLQTTGSVFGLPATVAEAIEQHAQNADLVALKSVVAELDVRGQAAVLSLLAQQAREVIGLEGRNVALAVLAICSDSSFPLNGGADAALESITAHLVASPQELPDDVIPGCWRLALSSNRDTAVDLRRVALRHPALDDDPNLAMLLLAKASAALAVDGERVARLLSGHLLDEGTDKVVAMLKTLSSAEAEQLVEASAGTLAKELSTAVENHDAWKSSQEQASVVAAGTVAPTEPVVDTEAPADPHFTLEALASLLEHWHETTPKAAHTIVQILLSLEAQVGRDTVEGNLAYVPAVRDVSLARLILTSATRRRASVWPQWLGVLTAELDLDAVRPQIESMYQRLWEQTTAEKSPLGAEVVATAADAFVRLIDDRPDSHRPDIAAVVLASLDGHAISDEDAAERTAVLGMLQPLVERGLLDRKAVLQNESIAVTATLSESDETITPPEEDGELLAYLAETVVECLRDFMIATEHPLSLEQATSLVEAVERCEWLPEPHRTQMRTHCRLHAGSEAVSQMTLDALPSASQMAVHARQYPQSGPSTVAAWIRVEEPSPADLRAATAALIRASRATPNSPLTAAIRDRLDALLVSDQVAFWRELVGTTRTDYPIEVLVAAGWQQLPDAYVAELLSDRYSNATNRSERQAVLDLWRAADLTSDRAKRLLLDRVLIPMLGTNQTTADTALSYVPSLLKAIPSGRRKTLRQAVESSFATSPGLEKKAINALKSIGYNTERVGLLRRERLSRDNDD